MAAPEQNENGADTYSEDAQNKIDNGGYADCGVAEDFFKCFQQMQMESVSPNTVTFIYGLKACSSIKAMHLGRELHADVFEAGCGRHGSVSSTLVDTYIKCGSLSEALEVFDRLPVQDVVSWTSLIAGYAQHGLGELALSCFQQMQSEDVSPDAASWNAVILAQVEQGDSMKALQLMSLIIDTWVKAEKLQNHEPSLGRKILSQQSWHPTIVIRSS